MIVPPVGTGLRPCPACTLHAELPAETTFWRHEQSHSWQSEKCELRSVSTIWHNFLSFQSTSHLVVEKKITRSPVYWRRVRLQ